MLGLDVKTILAFNALAAFATSVGLFMTSRRLEDGTRHGILWAYGSMTQALAYIFYGLRDTVSLEASSIPGNLFLYTAIVLYFLELHNYYNLPFRSKLAAIGASILALGLGIYYYSSVNPDINARVILISLWSGVISLRIAVMIGRKFREYPTRSSILTGLGFLLSGSILIIRALVVGSGNQLISHLFTQNLLQDITFLNSFFMVLVTTFGYVLMLNERIQDDLHRLATLDSLTEIFNRRMIMEQVKREFERTKRESTPTSLILLDLDNFKFVNDTFGHLAGDALLRKMVAMVSAEMREYDSLGRFGGDEFLIVAANTSEDEANQIANRILEKINQTPVPWKDEEVCLEASAGVGTFNLDDEEFEDALHRADQSLYRAKASRKLPPRSQDLN